MKRRMRKAVQRDADRVLDFGIERERKAKEDLATLRTRLAKLEMALSGDLIFSDAEPAPIGSPPAFAELLMSFLRRKIPHRRNLANSKKYFGTTRSAMARKRRGGSMGWRSYARLAHCCCSG